MLFFSRKQIPERSRSLTYDDVLLVPTKSEMRSRRDPELSTEATQKTKLKIPMISANMDTVTEAEMAIAMGRLGGLGILHRFMSIEEQIRQVHQISEAGVGPVAASIGVTDEDRERAKKLVQAGVKILTIDIAHGHSLQMIETMKFVRDTWGETLELIAGNVATPEAAYDLIQAGASAIKVGIGPGSMCTTRVMTGCGVPQLTAVALCAEVGDQHQVPIIADGGLRSSGDIVKALAAGAKTVMVGSLLAGTIETPGEIKQGRKLYRGMASKSAQVSWRGGVPEGLAPEGESTQVPVKGHVRDVIMEMTGGIRSGMTYLNANSIEEIRSKARFTEMSVAGVNESRAHGL